jgi:hypothetical protein
MVKLGRPPIVPRPDGTLHAAARWENRLWIHEEATKYGLTYGQIVDELVESLRKDRAYNPEKLAQILSTTPVKREDDYYADIVKNPGSIPAIIKQMDKERRTCG